MSKLTDFRLLSFDVYGTLIDYEGGYITALQSTLDPNILSKISRTELLIISHELEAAQQALTPTLLYSELLATIHPQIASKVGLPEPSAKSSKEFGASIGSWPAFPDTVSALKRLSKFYKLVVLSNVDRVSFSASNSGPLDNFPFDAILTAQDIGSYKPNLRNFEYMFKEAEKRFGIQRGEVLQTAQSQFHDHQPARKLGLKSSWIVRNGTMGNRDGPIFDWKFGTLEEMADAVEKEVKEMEGK